VVTVLPEVVLSVVPVVVLTGEDVLPDVVDAGVVVDPVRSRLQSCKLISCTYFPLNISLAFTNSLLLSSFCF